MQADTVVWTETGVPCHRIPRRRLDVSGIPYKLEVEAFDASLSLGKASIDLHLKTVTVVALGDSISSGEGLPHRLRVNASSKPEQWLERRCHRSFFNFTTLALAVAAEQAPTTTFEYINLACSGATITDSAGTGYGGLLKPYTGIQTADKVASLVREFPDALKDGNTSKMHLPSQLEQARKELKELGKAGENPDYVILTVGGNDLLFGPIIFQSILRKDCRESWGEWLLSWVKELPAECLFRKIKERMAVLDKELTELAKHINGLNPKNVMIIGYIDPTRDQSGQVCQDEKLGKRLLGPKSNARDGYLVDSKEAEKAYVDILTPLNKKLEAFVKMQSGNASGPRWRFIGPDAIQKAKMRGWCASPSWFVNYEDSFAKGGDQLGTAHPNIYGQNWLSWLVRRTFAVDKVLPAKLVMPDEPKR